MKKTCYIPSDQKKIETIRSYGFRLIAWTYLELVEARSRKAASLCSLGLASTPLGIDCYSRSFVWRTSPVLNYSVNKQLSKNLSKEPLFCGLDNYFLHYILILVDH